MVDLKAASAPRAVPKSRRAIYRIAKTATAKFDGVIDQMRPLLEAMLWQEPIRLGDASKFPEVPGVYLITDDSGYLYIRLLVRLG